MLSQSISLVPLVTHVLFTALLFLCLVVAPIIPLATAADANTRMACCMGKPGHEPGSCSSGLLEASNKPQPEPEILCGQKPVAATGKSRPASILTLSSRCLAECGTCSVGYARRPRPREHSTFSFAARPHVPSIHRLVPFDDSQTRTLNPKGTQLRPRAPPAFLA